MIHYNALAPWNQIDTSYLTRDFHQKIVRLIEWETIIGNHNIDDISSVYTLMNARDQIDYLNVIFLVVTLTSLYGWDSGNHENDQVADHLDHAQRVSGEQLHVIKGISYGSLTLPLLWFYGRLQSNHFWWRTWPSSNDHLNVTKIGAQMITLTSPIWPGALKSVSLVTHKRENLKSLSNGTVIYPDKIQQSLHSVFMKQMPLG